ncbi:hypothetical protein E2C01_044411 [Portunus trituberculatus]|uniref:Uncharacterized protein n=1 Tax=Portunus trituberculatus TaxID=210409 RepID=A0A5B7FZZ5_PORTR|nr:hypothetical protein [Portunus trituberculatus]
MTPREARQTRHTLACLAHPPHTLGTAAFLSCPLMTQAPSSSRACVGADGHVRACERVCAHVWAVRENLAIGDVGVGGDIGEQIIRGIPPRSSLTH